MNKERLKTGLEMMGVAADETALDRFEAFHAILDEYNARMDLTAVLDEDERVDRHDLDSAAVSRLSSATEGVPSALTCAPSTMMVSNSPTGGRCVSL